MRFLVYAKLQSMEDSRAQQTKTRVNPPEIFFDLYPLRLEIDYNIYNLPSMFSYFQARNFWFAHLPQPYQDTLQSTSMEPYHRLSYSQSMWLLDFSFTFAALAVSFCQWTIDDLSRYTFVYTPSLPLEIAFFFLNSHRFHLSVYLSITSILRVSVW